MIPERIKILYQKCLADTASTEEREEFTGWIRSPENESTAKEMLLSAIHENEATATFDTGTADAMLEAIFSAEDAQRPSARVHRVHFMRRWGWAAACFFAVLAGGIFYFSGDTGKTSPAMDTTTVTAILPGKSGAVLTLADGSRLVLDSLGNGVVAAQNGSLVVIKNGGLVYDLTGQAAGETAFNTMSTPRGRQFSVLLPDGTKVWLNAASSIRYPTVFMGNERRVTISGEVYFEVAKNVKMPFRVSAKEHTEVEVLGTHFNIDAYEDESTTHTTLLEGSVKVNGGLIRPGQQAQTVNDKLSIVDNADIDQVMAWKNGIFSFDNMPIDEVMRQLSRWYDIEVMYENGIPTTKMAGEMKRDLNLTQLLEALKELGLNYRIEGRKLIIKQ